MVWQDYSTIFNAASNGMSFSLAEDWARCLEAGMRDFVGKPVDPGMLYATLLTWLPQR